LEGDWFLTKREKKKKKKKKKNGCVFIVHKFALMGLHLVPTLTIANACDIQQLQLLLFLLYLYCNIIIISSKKPCNDGLKKAGGSGTPRMVLLN
jgi:hypothetical protein